MHLKAKQLRLRTAEKQKSKSAALTYLCPKEHKKERK